LSTKARLQTFFLFGRANDILMSVFSLFSSALFFSPEVYFIFRNFRLVLGRGHNLLTILLYSMYQIVNQPLTISPLIENEEDRQRPILFRSENISSNTSAAHQITAVIQQYSKNKIHFIFFVIYLKKKAMMTRFPGGTMLLVLKNKI